MASRRAKEVAIRKVLGAPARTIITILSKEFALLLTIANVTAWPLAYLLMKKWMQSFAFHTAIGLWVFILSGVLAFFIALVSVSYQTFRAASANPVNKLRNE
jgi:putative ABC transport system permease protein